MKCCEVVYTAKVVSHRDCIEMGIGGKALLDVMPVAMKLCRLPGIYWGYIGIMEKKMETTIMGYIGVI